MVTYRTAWYSSVILFGVVGAWTSLTASIGGQIAIFAFVMLAVTSVVLTVTDQDGAPPWRLAFTSGGIAGASVVAAVGLVELLGMTMALSVLGMLAVSSPLVVSRALRRTTRGSNGQPPALDEPEASDERANVAVVSELTALVAPARSPSPSENRIMSAPWMTSTPGSLDEASLCLAWRKTYVALQRVCSPRFKLGVVQRRQELLDEFERRNARGFTAWLASGARAAGDPSKYVFPPARARRRGSS